MFITVLGSCLACQSQQEKTQLSPVARVQISEGTVYRNKNFWQNWQNSRYLNQNETLQVTSASHLRLDHLASESEIVVSGLCHFLFSSHKTLTINGKRAILGQNSQIELTRDRYHREVVKVFQGELHFIDLNQVILAGKMIVMKDQQNLSQQEVPLTLTSPRDGYRQYFFKGERREYLTLRWSADLKIGSFQVQIADDREFAKKRTFYTNKTRLQYRVFKPGVNYWRVIGIHRESGRQLKSNTFQFESVDAQAPIILSDQEGKTYSYQKVREKGLPQLIWSDNSAPYHQIQLSREKRFSKIVVSKIVSKPRFQPQNLTPGPYFLRVRSFDDPENVGLWSQSLSFTIAMDRAPKQPDHIRISSHDGVTNLSWDPVDGAEAYKVEISQDADFYLVRVFRVDDPRFSYEGLAEYRYARVRALDFLGRRTSFSKPVAILDNVQIGPMVQEVSDLWHRLQEVENHMERIAPQKHMVRVTQQTGTLPPIVESPNLINSLIGRLYHPRITD